MCGTVDGQSDHSMGIICKGGFSSLCFSELNDIDHVLPSADVDVLYVCINASGTQTSIGSG